MTDALYEKVKRAFTEAAIFTFEKMTMVSLAIRELNGPDTAVYDLSGVIGFTGDIVGNCALRVSAETAQEAINRLAGETVESPSEVADGMGELVNMIAGNAKASLQDFTVTLAFPDVIRGKGHEIGFHRHPALIQVYFSSEIGDLTMIVAFSEPKSI